jgi:hypothetical protein
MDFNPTNIVLYISCSMCTAQHFFFFLKHHSEEDFSQSPLVLIVECVEHAQQCVLLISGFLFCRAKLHQISGSL